MTDATCPLLDALVARHNQLRAAAAFGRQLAIDRQQRMEAKSAPQLANAEAVHRLRPSIVSSRPAAGSLDLPPFDRAQFVAFMNNPMPRVLIFGRGKV